MGRLIPLPVLYNPDTIIRRKPFSGGYVLIPYSSIQPIITWLWHDVYYLPNRCIVFLEYLACYNQGFDVKFRHPALASILEEMRDCEKIVEADNASSGRWLTLPSRGDVLIPREVIRWCASRPCPRYAFALAAVCCSQMRRVREYRFVINQSRMASRLKINQATVSRLIRDMIQDGVLEHVCKAGKAKNGNVYRWSCSNYGREKRPEAAPDNIIEFKLPATGEKSVIKIRVGR